MIVYYKYCPFCYTLLPSMGPMIVRDTDTNQVINCRKEEIYLVTGDTLSLYCGDCGK